MINILVIVMGGPRRGAEQRNSTAYTRVVRHSMRAVLSNEVLRK